jgi:type IV pilus assembly protein PilN
VADGGRGGGIGFLTMRLDINLATQPYEDVRRFWMRWGTALAGAVLITLVLSYSAYSGWMTAGRDRALIRERQQQIVAREQEKQKAEALLNRPENSSTRDRSRFLNDLFERKAFSWTQVFTDLERVMPARLHLVSIRPEMAPGHQLALKLVVAGESRERAIELVRQMEDSRHFQETRIEEETVLSGQGDKVQFEITALYVPESEEAARRGTP